MGNYRHMPLDSVSKIHEWALSKTDRHEQLLALELVLAHDFADPDPARPRGLSQDADAVIRQEFLGLVASTGVAAGRLALRNLGLLNRADATAGRIWAGGRAEISKGSRGPRPGPSPVF